MFLFTYGSLMKDLGNHYLIKGKGKFIGNGVGKGKLYDLGNFPAIVKDCATIKGEIYEIDDTLLRKLDMLEGYSGKDDEMNLYTREEVEIAIKSRGFKSKKIIKAYCYFFNRIASLKKEQVVPSGDWKNHILTRGKYFWEKNCEVL